ncbi:hypothetical protein Y032_0273g986 [Ancylostoma ceylanicum]|uniref:Uncharacterized protein n=1 Tax=Ancylostoma ceylanicum TaxID=53326 RepID=A0A016S816_9BILA|nr:hypothetical protein Y032_0273g986 [Ancylostoma ceylanicum]
MLLITPNSQFLIAVTKSFMALAEVNAQPEKIFPMRLCEWCAWSLLPWISSALMASKFLMGPELQKQAG